MPLKLTEHSILVQPYNPRFKKCRVDRRKYWAKGVVTCVLPGNEVFNIGDKVEFNPAYSSAVYVDEEVHALVLNIGARKASETPEKKV